MGILKVHVQLTSYRILTRGDRVIIRRDVVDDDCLNFVCVLLEEREAKDAKSDWIGFQLLHDQVVVFSCLDEGAVFANGLTELLLVFFIELKTCFLSTSLAFFIYDKLHERVASA